MGVTPIFAATVCSHVVMADCTAATLIAWSREACSKSSTGGRSTGRNPPFEFTTDMKKLAWLAASWEVWKKWYAPRSSPALFIPAQLAANWASVLEVDSVALAKAKTTPADFTAAQFTLPCQCDTSMPGVMVDILSLTQRIYLSNSKLTWTGLWFKANPVW